MIGGHRLDGGAEDIYPNKPSPFIEPVEWCSGRRVSVQVKTLGWAAGPRSGQSCTTPPARCPPDPDLDQKNPPISAEGGFSALLFCNFQILSLYIFAESFQIDIDEVVCNSLTCLSIVVREFSFVRASGVWTYGP